MDLLRNATPLQKAEGYLRFWAERIAEWGDLEAVVYLLSRGNDCSSIIRKIQANWHEAENEAVQRFIHHDIADTELSRTIKENPTDFVNRFWSFYDSQELSIDATMLRAAQWGNIQGYEKWWRALDKDLREGAFSGGIHLFSLFNFCRADYAVQNMSHTLRVSLNLIEALSPRRQTPWWRNDGNLGCARHDAAALIFPHARVRPSNTAPGYVARAVDDLRKYFDHDRGAWAAFSGRPDKLSVEFTAMSLHALCAAGVNDWNQFAGPALAWLWSQQQDDGNWHEDAAPDPVWLTVLVLDAIEMASGGTKLTFQLGLPVSSSPLVFVAYQHEDYKWLEEIKKHLGGLIHSGRIEFFDDRQIGGGQEWDPIIKQKLADAKIIVPIMSPDFMGSKYIHTVELPTAIARHKEKQVTVLPILVEACDWEGLGWDGFSLSQINVLPRDKRNNLKPARAWGSKKHEALMQVAKEIRRLLQLV